MRFTDAQKSNTSLGHPQAKIAGTNLFTDRKNIVASQKDTIQNVTANFPQSFLTQRLSSVGQLPTFKVHATGNARGSASEVF